MTVAELIKQLQGLDQGIEIYVNKPIDTEGLIAPVVRLYHDEGEGYPAFAVLDHE